MDYMKFETNNLLSHIEINVDNSIKWSSIGTSVDAINSTEIKYGYEADETGIIHYILPIVDIEVATAFIETVNGEIISEETAIGLIAQYKAFMEV